MNATIALQLVKSHQAELRAEAAEARLAADAKGAGRTSGRVTGTWRFIASFAAALAR